MATCVDGGSPLFMTTWNSWKPLKSCGGRGAGDVLRGLHIQEQGRYSGERNHLTTCLDLHKDHLGPGGSVAHLGLGGELKVEIGLSPRGGLYVRSFIDEAQSHHGRVGVVQGLGGYQDGQGCQRVLG